MKLLSDSTFDSRRRNYLIFIFIFMIFCFWKLNAVSGQTHPAMPSLTPLQKAESLLAMKRYSEAIDAFEALLDNHEKREYVVRGLTRAYREAGKALEGKNTLNDRLSRASKPSDFLYGLGYWFYLEGSMKESEMYLEEAVKKNPNHALALNNLGAVFSEEGYHRRAKEKVKNALDLNPSEPMFFQNLFLIYKKEGKKDRYLHEYESYLKSGRLELAIGYGKVLARNLRQKAFKFYSEGSVKMALESFQEVVSVYKDINYTPGLTAAFFSLGLLYEEKGQAVHAIKYFRQVLQISPGHIQARQRLKVLEEGFSVVPE